jgi:hypothetical protein
LEYVQPRPQIPRARALPDLLAYRLEKDSEEKALGRFEFFGGKPLFARSGFRVQRPRQDRVHEEVRSVEIAPALKRVGAHRGGKSEDLLGVHSGLIV